MRGADMAPAWHVRENRGDVLAELVDLLIFQSLPSREITIANGQLHLLDEASGEFVPVE